VFEEAAPKLNVDGIGNYGNYSDSEARSPSGDKAAALWGENYPRLQQIKKKYDPDMLFNKWFNITPAA
jgi:FAD/FMN-containing dehydrogenase